MKGVLMKKVWSWEAIRRDLEGYHKRRYGNNPYITNEKERNRISKTKGRGLKYRNKYFNIKKVYNE